MSMPGGIEIYRRYTSEAAFEADREALLTEGWALQDFHAARQSGWRAWLGRGQAIEARYVRPDWPTE
jgi:hypothetical protein